MRTRLRWPCRLGTALAMAVVPLAVAPGTAGASAASATIQIENQAQLQPDGSVLVTIDYSCLNGGVGVPSSIFIEVRQPSSAGTASGSATCDDQKHKATLDVIPGPFNPGPAFVSAVAGNGFSNASTQAEIMVK